MEHRVEQTLIKNVQHSWAELRWYRKKLSKHQQKRLKRHFSWKQKAPISVTGSWRALSRNTQQNKYVNKVECQILKGGRKGLHLSLFRNDYPVTIPPKLKWSFFSLKVNKWQEWDLQPGFSVSQFSSTNH